MRQAPPVMVDGEAQTTQDVVVPNPYIPFFGTFTAVDRGVHWAPPTWPANEVTIQEVRSFLTEVRNGKSYTIDSEDVNAAANQLTIQAHKDADLGSGFPFCWKLTLTLDKVSNPSHTSTKYTLGETWIKLFLTGDDREIAGICVNTHSKNATITFKNQDFAAFHLRNLPPVAGYGPVDVIKKNLEQRMTSLLTKLFGFQAYPMWPTLARDGRIVLIED